MKILLKVLTVLVCIFANSTLSIAFDNSGNTPENNEIEDVFNSTHRDSLQLNDKSWPSCPGVESSRLIILDERTYLLKWDITASSKIEYNVQVLDGGNLLSEERNNTGIYIFQLDPSLPKNSIALSITAMCYYDYDKEPINSGIYLVGWSDLMNQSADFCAAYEDLILFDHLPSFHIFNTRLPADVNFKFDICQDDDCHYYDHSISKSAILEKRKETYSVANPKLLTKFGNFSCSTTRSSGDVCESIVVTELEDCMYEVTLPDGVSSNCDLDLLAHKITHSLCGYATGRIIVRPVGGNEPYHYAWNTGDEGFEDDLNHLLPGNYTVTVTDVAGCEIISNVTIQEEDSVNFHESGGDGGLVETLTLPAGMDLIWKFNPIGVTDQFIMTGQSLNLDTGPITNNTEESCGTNSNCSCSLVFMGDYDNGDILPIEAGNATKNYPYAVGEVLVPDDGVVNLNVIGANCASGTGWTLKLECSTEESPANSNEPNDIKYVGFAAEVSHYLKSGIITTDQYQEDSIRYFNYEQKLTKANRGVKSSSRSGNNPMILDFRCSGFVASPYTIRLVDDETGDEFTCDIIDQVSCPECDDNTEGCEYVDYILESDPWDPFCNFSWKIDFGFDTEMEILNEAGDIVMQTSDLFGDWNFENGESYEVQITLENNTLSTTCYFTIECPEPDLPTVDESICEYFNDFGVSLENESSLLFFSDGNLSESEIEEFNLLISQISEIKLDINWQLGPDLQDHLLFDADNGGTANLFQLDPQNLTFILEDYDMKSIWDEIQQGTIFSPDDRLMRYNLRIVDIYGNEIICEFENIVEFPEEEVLEENPLCLSCGDGVYDPNEDLEGYTLGDGDEYEGPFEGETVYIYGFPIHITYYSSLTNEAEGILSLPFDECKVLAVKLVDFEIVELPIEKRLWVKTGQVIPHDTYPGQLPNFDIAPDFEFGAEICIPPRAPNDVNGDGIDDNTNLDKYGFKPNGEHINGTNLDDNGFDVEGHYMGCPRTDNPNLPCSIFNDDGCDRDGKDEKGNPCPVIDEEEWDDFVDEYEETSDSLIAAIVCDFSEESTEEMEEKTSECDSLRTLMDTYIGQANLTPEEIKLIKGDSDEYFDSGLSGHFINKPKIPTPAIGGRVDAIKNIEKVHVDLYYCDLELQPIEEEEEELGNLCTQGNTTEIQSMINQALDDLSNLDRQRLMLDQNAFQKWIKDLVKEYLKEEHDIYIGSVFPKSFEIDLFDKPTKAHYQGTYNSVASIGNGAEFNSDFNIMDAIDFEYKQGFDEINGVPRAYFVSQLGKYNQENYSSLSGVEPVALQNVLQSSIFSIYLVNFRFYSDQPAKVDAYIELSDPKSDRKIYFSAKDVVYNPNGIEEDTMQLATTISKFKISNAARGTILKGDSTYLKFNCNGVNEIGIKGEVEFCDNIIIPMQQIGDKNDFERHDDPYFKMGFAAVFTEWLEFEAQITAGSPFAMAKQEDLIWDALQFSFDFSSSTSQFVGNFNVPGGFNSPFVEGSSLGPGWKGFYCSTLKAVLPAITKNQNGDRHTAINVSDLLIDKYGVTCSAEVSGDILTLGQPNMKSGSESTGWSLSINYFRLDAVQNFIVGGGMRGQVITSLFKNDAESALDYSALILPGQKYKFSITPKVNLEVPLLVAKAEIESAAIDVTYDASQESFEAQAKFSGNIRVNNDLVGAKLPYLEFNNLTVMNKAPYISGGKWKLQKDSDSDDESEDEDTGSYKGFSFSLENLKFEECEGGSVLSTTINVGFGLNGDNNGSSDEVKNSNLNISGDFGLRGIFHPDSSGIQGFKFDKAFLNGLAVTGNIGDAVKDIDVKLCWDENNPDYGDTFYGSGKATILKFGEVGVAAQFGEKDDEKYFFVDAFADIPAVPIGGPIGVNMIGAGVSNNMSIQGSASGSGTPPTITEEDACSPPACASNFGQTYTGFTYGFDAAQALAMRVSLGFGMTKGPEDFVEGSAGIDLTFNDGGGIDKFGFFGEATFLASFPNKLGKVIDFINEVPVDKLGGIVLDSSATLDLGGAKPEISDSLPLTARVEGQWDFGAGIFDLTAGAFLDWGVLKGAGNDNALTLGRFRIGGGEWNVSLGTPTSPSGVVFNLGIVDAHFKTYFMAGDPLSEDWIPYVPPKVKSFFSSGTGFDFLETMPSSGAGFAFGVHFAAGFDVSVPILGSAYADLMAGIDVAMVNNIKCNGAPIGFGSGWYARGQAYLYAGAGLRVLGVDLIKGEAGIIMNAGLTNPSYFNGKLQVSGKFGIWPLKFTIKGSIDVELGDEPNCTWYVFDEGEVLEVLGELSIVESTLPTPGATDVSTSLSEYLINYSVPMGEELELIYPDTLSNGDIVDQSILYRIDVSRIELISTKTGAIRDYNPYDDGQNEVLGLTKSLPANDSIVVRITYNVDMKIPDTDKFIDAITEEVIEYSFKTGPLALRFEPANISGSWPANGMDNFYLDHRLDYGGKPKGVVGFKNRFPWEIFHTPTIQVRTALYQGDNLEPIIDVQLDPNEYFNVHTGETTGAGSLFFDLPENMAPEKHYKVTIYAISDTSDNKMHLMDPIHFRTSKYLNLEQKFAEADSMFYVEASPRIGAEFVESTYYTYVCGFEYNLVSKPEAPESWDEFDARYIKFSPLCEFDYNRERPKLNSPDFVDCEFEEVDEPPIWEQAELYELTSVEDILTTPGASSSLQSSNQNSTTRAETIGVNIASLEQVYLSYRLSETLHYKYGGFLLKGCQ